MRRATLALFALGSLTAPAAAFDPAPPSPYERPAAPQAAPAIPDRGAPAAPPLAFPFHPGFGLAPRAQVLPPAPGPQAPRYGWGPELDARIAAHAAANGIPLDLARRVVRRESNGNPRAVSKGNYGLMQIRLGTARAMGYRGDARGLLDPETNMTYAMRYLAGAYRAARGNPDRAIALYSRGYYYEAKAMGFSPYDPPRAAGVLPVAR